MRFLNNAHAMARQCRQKIGVSSENLLERIEKYLGEAHQIELSACHKDVIDGGKAEIRPAEGVLYYSEELKNNPEEKLWVIVHELGHLELHSERLTKLSCKPDPIYSTMYSFAGASSLTRYNKKSLEEVEANAFAAEFLCPSDAAFQLWYSTPYIKLKDIAKAFGAPSFVVRSQLAEALYQIAFKAEPEEAAPKRNIDFNERQIKASEKIGVPVLVDAGPGTGKTATLLRRIEFLLGENREKQEDPSNILVLTFSNEACSELYERISLKFGKDVASQIRIATFHGFGLSLIQLHGQFRNLDANTCVIDEAGQRELFNEIIGEFPDLQILKISKPEETVKELVRHISYLKERMITPQVLELEIANISEDDADAIQSANDLLKIYKAYEKLKDTRKKLDFADLIQKSIEIFTAQPEVLRINREKYKWVLVDEYQDVSRATAILLKNLCGKDNPPWVVGDKRQSIFRFCGAHPENMDEFENDFPGACKFTLSINYRSSNAIIENKNNFAALMNSESNGRKIWQGDSGNPTSNVNPATSFAVAESDEAERNGIVKKILSWTNYEDEASRVKTRDIAVLARRNVDVRNIVLSLSRKGIPAVASGVITAEGIAGDLANIITFADNPLPSIPRLVYCLANSEHKIDDLNELVTQLLERYSADKEFVGGTEIMSVDLFNAVGEIYEGAKNEKYNADAFSMICIFLFESSAYLRKILNSSNEIEKSLALNEIITTLTQAATYRFSHQEAKSHDSRKDFAKYFRELLSQSTTPTTAPPNQMNVNAVKVMTCHASKGLEFPFVLVAGQTLSEIGRRGEYSWLPASLSPKKEDDYDQSDSALFVGISRAKQGLAVSYSKTSSGLPNARSRRIVPLLQKWREAHQIEEEPWNSFNVIEKETFDTGRIWGGEINQPIASRKLDKSDCALATYLQDGLGLRFPLVERSFYPTFYVAVRQVLNSVVKAIVKNSGRMTQREAFEILKAYWDFEDFRINKEHTHHNLYWNLAQKYVSRFIDAFVPETGEIEFVDLVVGEQGQEIQLDLVCAYIVNGSSPRALFFRPESLKGKLNDKGKLAWSKVEEYRRIPFILLRNQFPELQIRAFSGTDGELYDFVWANQNRFIETQKTNISGKLDDLTNNRFSGSVSTNTCDYRCENRINCPHWIGALN